MKNIIQQLRKYNAQLAAAFQGFVLKPQANEDLSQHAGTEVTDAMRAAGARGQEHRGFDPGMMQPSPSIQTHPLAMGTFPNAQVEQGIDNELAGITPQILAHLRVEGGLGDKERHGNLGERVSALCFVRLIHVY